MKRKTEDWIDQFVEYTSSITSPIRFRRWAAISTISAALQRRVYTKIAGRRQFTNMFILLVAPPGVGKTAAIQMGREFCRHQPAIKLTANRITAQALYIELEAAGQTITDLLNKDKPVDIHHSLTAMIDEFSVFVKKNDIDFMADLADLFDCPDPFEYKTKNSGVNYAKASWFNLIAGCTPYTVKETFSADAIEMGFPARIILVYSNEIIQHTDIFTNAATAFDHPEDNEEFQVLSTDLEQILTLSGAMTWTPEAQRFLSDWYRDKLRPYPKDTKLQHYCTRRLTHLSKLAMICSASRGNDMDITLTDIHRAKDILLEAEEHMPGATEALGSNQYYAVQVALLTWMDLEYRRTEKPISEAVTRRKLMREAPPMLVDQMIESMVAGRYLESVGLNTKPDRLFIPHLPTKED